MRFKRNYSHCSNRQRLRNNTNFYFADFSVKKPESATVISRIINRFLAPCLLMLISLNSLSQNGPTEPAIETKIDALLSTMTIEQKVGQMIQGEIKFVSPDDLRRYGLGSVLNGGGSFPNGDKHADVSDWLELADEYYLASIDSSKGNAAIPLIWGTDAVHGHNNVIGATLFPHNIGLGAVNDPALMRRIGEITADEVAATGIDWIFAPTVAVAKDDRWGRTYESYADQIDLVAEYAGEIVEGIQSQGLIATAKHFIGDGGTYRGIDQGNTIMTLDELLDQHAKGYINAIDAGVMTVMASFNSWNGKKVHGQHQLLTDVLKNQMGFNGFVVSDWNGIGQIEGCTNDSCPQAINAGIDMVMAPEDWKSLHKNMVDQVINGEISQSRIDDAVRRILRVKIKSGILDAPLPSSRHVSGRPGLGHESHREIAREAVRRSLVLLKNNEQLLPLNPTQHILVTGSGANDIGRQSGGWTITWQGAGNQNSDFPGATSIYQGIADVVNSAGGTITQSIEHVGNEKPDAAVVVFGEYPYAEGNGDVLTLSLDKIHLADYQLLKRLRSEGIPVVAVFLSGRPMWVNREINASDAFVAAWLPGTEGGGVADVLFSDGDGNPRFDFEGRLSFDWPGQDLNPNDHHLPVVEHLFDNGYGLNYQSKVSNMAMLNEQRIGFEESMDIIVFKRGTRAPWNLFLGDEKNWSRSVSNQNTVSDGNTLKVGSKDYQFQEDARQFTWNNDRGKPAQVYWQAENPMDFLPLQNADGALSLVLRVDQKLQGKAEIRMDCGWPCKGALNISNVFKETPLNAWNRISIPLSCFTNRGLDIQKVNTAFLLSVTGTLQLTIAEVSLLEKPPEESIMDCEVKPEAGVLKIQ